MAVAVFAAAAAAADCVVDDVDEIPLDNPDPRDLNDLKTDPVVAI